MVGDCRRAPRTCRTGIHGDDDFQLERRAADAGKGFVADSPWINPRSNFPSSRPGMFRRCRRCCGSRFERGIGLVDRRRVRHRRPENHRGGGGGEYHIGLLLRAGQRGETGEGEAGGGVFEQTCGGRRSQWRVFLRCSALLGSSIQVI